MLEWYISGSLGGFGLITLNRFLWMVEEKKTVADLSALLVDPGVLPNI